MNIYEAINDGWVVGADEWLSLIVVWYGGATFIVFSENSNRSWVENDVFTDYEANSSNASLKAKKYFERIHEEMYEIA